MQKILCPGDFLAADDPEFFVDALRINDEFENTDYAEQASKVIKNARQCAHQCEEYIKLFPGKADNAVSMHNEAVTKMFIELAEDLNLAICADCRKYFISQRKEHLYCSGCWEQNKICANRRNVRINKAVEVIP